jgi:starch-binding outer membrane protein SusE/F
MKHTLLRLMLPSLLLLGLWSCEKDEYKIYLESGTPPVLTASTTGPLVLTRSNAANTAVRLSWTNPNYRFTTGPSSQDVIYLLQIDRAGQNFSSPIKQEISIAKDLGVNWTVADLNGILTKMDLPENVPHDLELRVRASLADGTVPLFSNVLRITVTPYLDVAVPVPANGNLWITGDAAPSGWSNPLTGSAESNQKFTRISNTLYELTIALPGGGAYKLLQDNGNWGTQYHMLPGGTWEGGEFEMRDADPAFPGPPSAGTYKITVNFKTGRYTVVKQ